MGQSHRCEPSALARSFSLASAGISFYNQLGRRRQYSVNVELFVNNLFDGPKTTDTQRATRCFADSRAST